jgi:hypothetical protein
MTHFRLRGYCRSTTDIFEQLSCRGNNKVALGFVEGLNNKIRELQRRAYGFHEEEYLRLKILTCMLPKLEF